MTDDFNHDFSTQEELPTIRGLARGDRVLHKFVLQQCLGRGGMGEVWLAHDEFLGENLALKLLPPVVREDDHAIEELKSETRSGRQMSHPNIVRVFDFHKDERNAAIAMEYVEGESLSKAKKNQPNGVFNEDQLTAWVVNLASALDYAHRKGVVHRDLKPSNLLISTKDHSLKIVDFGIARSLADSLQRCTRNVQAVGTLAYMSPEQALGRSPHVADDIYSLGATIYELLAGTPPFFTGEIFHQLQKVPPQPINERRREKGINEPVSPIWERAVMHCLAKDRSQRPQSGREVLDLLGIVVESGYSPQSTVTHAYPIDSTTTGQPHPFPPLPNTASQQELDSLGYLPTTKVGGGTARPAPSFSTGVSGDANAAIPTATNPQVLRNEIHTTPILRQPIAVTVTQAVPSSRKNSQSNRWTWIIASIMVAGAGAGSYSWWVKQHQMEVDLTDKKSPDTNTVAKTEPVAKVEPKEEGSDPPETNPKDPAPAPAPIKHQLWEVPNGFPTIQAAIDAATGAQVIKIAPGIHQGELLLKSGITLMADSNEPVFVEANARVFSAIRGSGLKDVKLIGLTFRAKGGERIAEGEPLAVFEDSAIEVKRCSFDGSGKVGLIVKGDQPTSFIDCSFTNCKEAGARVSEKGKATFENCKFVENGGFGLVIEGEASNAIVTNTDFSQNADAGFEIRAGGTASIKDSKSNGNTVAGFLIQQPGSFATIQRLELSKNTTKGGEIRDGAGAQITGGEITGSDAVGLYLQDNGKVVLNGITIKGNQKFGIYVKALRKGCDSVEIRECTILNSSAVGIFVEGTGASATVIKNDLGPNIRGDIAFSLNATGTARENKLRSVVEPIVIDDRGATATEFQNEFIPQETTQPSTTQ